MTDHGCLVVATGVIIGRATSGGYTAVSIRRDAAPFLVDTDIVEVEKIPVVAANESQEADGSLLNWIAFRPIDGYPVSASIIGGGDVKVPDALIRRLILEVSARGAAEEAEGSSITITSHDCWKDCALDPARSILVSGRATSWHADLIIICPGGTVIG